jgi:hypothetical protein
MDKGVDSVVKNRRSSTYVLIAVSEQVKFKNSAIVLRELADTPGVATHGLRSPVLKDWFHVSLRNGIPSNNTLIVTSISRNSNENVHKHIIKPTETSRYHGHSGQTMGQTTEPVVAQVWLQLSHENDLVAMVTRLNLSHSHAYWSKLNIHLRSLNARRFKIVKAMGLQFMASTSSSVEWPPC